MLTRKAKYAIKAVLVLAQRGTKEPVMIGDLAKSAGVPKKFLELILLELRNKGILQSRRGKLGGYLLTASPKSLTVGTVVRMVDGPMAPVPCLSKTAYRRCDDCPEEGFCGVRIALKEAYQASFDILEKTTIQDILEKAAHAEVPDGHLAMYYI